MTDPGTPALELAELVDLIEQRLLGGPRKHTRGDVARAAELPADDARDLWRALGFAALPDDQRAFTDADIDALQRVRELGDVIQLDGELLNSMTRMLGRTFSRLASWQGQIVLEHVGSSPELLQSPDEILDYVDRMLAMMQDLQTYVWRRQLAAYLSRVAMNASLTSGNESTMAVGFADMAQFTTLTRRSSEAELRTVLETFETVTTQVVGAHRGQIVKTIGDEILFVADDASDGAEIALELLAAAEHSEVLPELRVGLAAGPVVSRLGDVFGATVNIASRLTSLARPGSVLVDEGMSTALGDDERYSLRSLRPTSVRGYQHLHSWRLRRPSGGRERR